MFKTKSVEKSSDASEEEEANYSQLQKPQIKKGADLCTVFLCAFCACVSFSSVSNKTCDELQKDLWVGENPREAAKRREGREERGHRGKGYGGGDGGGGGSEFGIENTGWCRCIFMDLSMDIGYRLIDTEVLL